MLYSQRLMADAMQKSQAIKHHFGNMVRFQELKTYPALGKVAVLSFSYRETLNVSGFDGLVNGMRIITGNRYWVQFLISDYERSGIVNYENTEDILKRVDRGVPFSELSVQSHHSQGLLSDEAFIKQAFRLSASSTVWSIKVDEQGHARVLVLDNNPAAAGKAEVTKTMEGTRITAQTKVHDAIFPGFLKALGLASKQHTSLGHILQNYNEANKM